MPVARLPSEDAKYGKQVLLLLALQPDKLAEEFEHIKQARFEMEGSPPLLLQPRPTSAEELQIIDRILRRPRRLGGAELHYPPRPELTRLGRDAGFPPPSWRVGGVELIEACYPLHDRDFNQKLHESFKKSWFLSEAQLTAVRGHYGEEIGFIFAYYDMKNRAPQAGVNPDRTLSTASFSILRSHHAVGMCVPVAAIGVVVSVLKYVPGVAGSKSLVVLQTAFGLTMVLWGAAVLVLWNRRKTHLQHVWGIQHFAGRRSYERPEFECWHDPATGNPRYYPVWMRNAKRTLSLFVTFLQVPLQLIRAACTAM